MALEMRFVKTGAHFEWTDDEAKTAIIIDPADDESTVVRKIKRIIALVEGGQGFPAMPMAELTTTTTGETRANPPSHAGNGWAAIAGKVQAPPDIPERLKGDVELIEPGEGE